MITEPWVSGFATFSRCGRYRYDLGRLGSTGKGVCLFVLNNPSTADSLEDDPTVRRGWAYTKSWGYRDMVFTNTNPYMSTNPDEAKDKYQDFSLEILKQNDECLLKWAKAACVVVAAWGIEAEYPLIVRTLSVIQRVSDISALELCKDGTPKHILYLKKDLRPVARYAKFPNVRSGK